MTEFVTPHLRTVLKTYQDTATKSLHGPAGLSMHHHHHHSNLSYPSPSYPPHAQQKYEDEDEPMEDGFGRRSKATSSDDHLHRHPNDANDLLVVQIPPPPELPHPILTEPDTNGCGTLYETVLEGRRIGCFMQGGELRLCLPQVLNNVLMDFSLDQINCTCERLQIFCSQCTPEQLNEFKAAKILPEDVKTSGLITRTNAERLCAALLSRGEKPPPTAIKATGVAFRVSHRCFGGADGVCRPELFSLKQPLCIECCDCGEWFSPHTFVFHGHRPQEEQTCHWGFDSGKWRAYIHVADDYYVGRAAEEKEKSDEEREKLTVLLDEMKEREYQESILWMQEQQLRTEEGLKRKLAGVATDGFPDNVISNNNKNNNSIPVVDSCKASELLDTKSARNLHPTDGRDSSMAANHRTPPTTPTSLLPPPHKQSKHALDEPPSAIEWHQYQSQVLLAAAHLHQQHPQLHPHFQALPFGPPPPPPPPSHWAAAAALNSKFLPQFMGLNGLSYLANQQEPPLLQNPERVIRLNECERFERSFQPNVALAPRQRLKEAHNNTSQSSVLVKVKQEPAEHSSSTTSGHTTTTTTTKVTTKSPEQFSTEITSSTSPQPVGRHEQQQHHHYSNLHNQNKSSEDFKENKTAALSIFPVKMEPLTDSQQSLTTQHIVGNVSATSTLATKAALKQNAMGPSLPTNSEFELSTDDTDDESSSLMSANGTCEADSSQVCVQAPLEAAHQLLKDSCNPENTDKVLAIIKMLLHENWQRQVGQENLRLREELRRRDVQIMEIQSLLREREEQLMRFHTNGAVSKSPASALVVKLEGVLQHPPQPPPQKETQNDEDESMMTDSSRGLRNGTLSNAMHSSGSAIKLKRKAILEMNNCLAEEEKRETENGAKRIAVSDSSSNNDCNISATNCSSISINNNSSFKNNNMNGGTTITAIKLPLKKSLRRSPEAATEEGNSSNLGEENIIKTEREGAVDLEDQMSKSVPLTIQSKKHRIFLNKQRQEEEEEAQKRRGSTGARSKTEVMKTEGKGGEADSEKNPKEMETKIIVGVEKDKNCIVPAEKMELDQNGGDTIKSTSKKATTNGESSSLPVVVGKRNGKLMGEEAANKVNSTSPSSSPSVVSASPMQQQQLQCAG